MIAFALRRQASGTIRPMPCRRVGGLLSSRADTPSGTASFPTRRAAGQANPGLRVLTRPASRMAFLEAPRHVSVDLTGQRAEPSQRAEGASLFPKLNLPCRRATVSQATLTPNPVTVAYSNSGTAFLPVSPMLVLGTNPNGSDQATLPLRSCRVHRVAARRCFLCFSLLRTVVKAQFSGAAATSDQERASDREPNDPAS